MLPEKWRPELLDSFELVWFDGKIIFKRAVFKPNKLVGFHYNSRVTSEVVEEMIKLFRVNETLQ